MITDDIELRFVESEVVERLGVDHTKVVQIRTLQVRRREGPRGESWWGKWEDVQTVREEDAE